MLAVQILIAFCVALVLTLLLFRKWPQRREGETMKNSVFGALAVIFDHLRDELGRRRVGSLLWSAALRRILA